MPNFRLLLEYDGSEFHGWQAQPAGQRTVQRCLADALADLAGHPVRVTGSGRTDAGVHAVGQVASVELALDLEPRAIRRALNARLPSDLAVLGVERVGAAFDARRDALGKLYRYRVWNGGERSPLRAASSAYVRGRLDLGAMREAAASLVGCRDFASFQAAGSGVVQTRRRLTRLAASGEPGAEIEFEVEGSGFLRHMVRNLVGTLLEVGQGRRPRDSMAALLAARDRSLAGPTAPARGLCLVAVRYAPAEIADPPGDRPVSIGKSGP